MMYPSGIRKNTTSQDRYDPTTRPWFINASSLSYNMFGPYVESFTGLHVVTLSTRNSTTQLKVQGSSSSSVNIVAGAILLIDDVAKIINSFSYNDGGFGALMKYQTNEVLAWHNNTGIYDSKTHKFYDVSHFDAILATHDLKHKSIIEYTDKDGANWFVSTTPFFKTSYRDTGTSDYTLVLLVFYKKSQILKPFNSLPTQIDDTISNATTRTMITISTTATVVLVVILFLVLYIAKPFEVMRSISKEIIRISTKEEDLKDYSTLVDDAYFNLTRTDEVGLLAADYYDIVCLLHYGAIEKKEAPKLKYPLNRFHLNETEVRQIVAPTTGRDQPDVTRAVTSADLIEAMKAKESPTAFISAIDDDRVYTSPSIAEEGVLHLHHLYPNEISSSSSSSRRSYRSLQLTEIDASEGGASSGIDGLPSSSLNDIIVEEGGDSSCSINIMIPSATDDPLLPANAMEHRTPSLASRLIAFKSRMRAVGTCSSIKSQLYMMSAMLLLGLITTMIITVLLVDTEAQSLTVESSSYLGEDNMHTCTHIGVSHCCFSSSLDDMCRGLAEGTPPRHRDCPAVLREGTHNCLSVDRHNLFHTADYGDIMWHAVQTYFEQLALDLRVAGIVFAQLLNDELARPDYNTNSQHRLTSYSMQNDNTYAYPDDFSHNDFSGYYMKVNSF